MISAANRWQSEIVKPARGTQPIAATWGTVVTADVAAHTKGAWVDIIVAADWSGFTGDAFEIEIRFNNSTASAIDHRALADIGIDSGGGYASIIDNLAAGYASGYGTNGEGVVYRFNLRIANGVKIGCRIQALIGSDTVQVAITVKGNPTNPGLVRVGTAVTTIGADTANSGGVIIAGGGAADGAWTQMIASSAADYWAWEFGYQCQDTVFTGGCLHIDIGTGAAAAEVPIVQDLIIYKQTTEVIAKPIVNAVYPVAAATRISARIQAQGNEANQSVILYATSGSYELPNAANATGTVTIGGVAVANGKTVEIYALDADSVVELIGTTVTAGGAGGFSLGCPDTTRSYFARYVDGATTSSSINGTPGVTAFNITIPGGGGGDVTAPTIAIISPTPGVAPGAPGGFSADEATALQTPIVIRITDAGGNRYQSIVMVRGGSETVVYRRGAFRGEFVARSFVVTSTPLELSILPSAGWASMPSLNSVSFEVDAVDTSGNLA